MYSLILHGRRFFELHKWRYFRAITVKTVHASASAGDLSRKGKIFTVSYLVESLGLPTKLAESISGKENSSSVLNLLRTYKFTDSQISRIVTAYPRLLTMDAEKTLLPMLQAMQSRGASSSELTEIVSLVPKILRTRGAKSVASCYDFIKEIIHKDKGEEGQDKSFRFDSCYSRQGNKIRNILSLRELGVPQRVLFRLLVSKSQPVCGEKKFQESVKKVMEMGFDPKTSNFITALHVFYEVSEKILEEKVNVYKGLGFEVKDVWEMFKKCPFSLKLSEKKITQTFETLKKCGLTESEVISVMKKRPACMRESEEKITNCLETFLELGFSRDEFRVMVKCFPSCTGLAAESTKKKVDFLVKTMNWSLGEVVVIPPVLGYSLEKRIMPRSYVIKALVSKGLIRNPPMSSVFAITDQKFVNRFVMRYEKKLVPKLMAIFNGDRVCSSLTKRAKDPKRNVTA